MNIYEGMFLFEAKEKAEWEPLRAHALEILERHGAKVLREEKWAERKLAYEIKRVRRGIYFLTYFEADPQSIDAMRRDCTLSELVLRVLFLRRDELPEEKKPEEAESTEGAAAKPDAKPDDKPEAKPDDKSEAKPEGEAQPAAVGADAAPSAEAEDEGDKEEDKKPASE